MNVGRRWTTRTLVAGLLVIGTVVLIASLRDFDADGDAELTTPPSSLEEASPPNHPTRPTRVTSVSDLEPGPASTEASQEAAHEVEGAAARLVRGRLRFVDRRGNEVAIESGELEIEIAWDDGSVSAFESLRVPFEAQAFSFELRAEEEIQGIGPAFVGPFEISHRGYDVELPQSRDEEFVVTLIVSDLFETRVVDDETGLEIQDLRLYAGSMVSDEVFPCSYTDALGLHPGTQPILECASPLRYRSVGLSYMTIDAPGHAAVEFNLDGAPGPKEIRLPRSGRLDIVITADWQAVKAAGDIELRIMADNFATTVIPITGADQQRVVVEGLTPGEAFVSLDTPGQGEQQGYQLVSAWPTPVIAAGKTTSLELDLTGTPLAETRVDLRVRIKIPAFWGFDAWSHHATYGYLRPPSESSTMTRTIKFEYRKEEQDLFADLKQVWPGPYLFEFFDDAVEVEIPRKPGAVIDIVLPDRPPLEVVFRDPSGRILGEKEMWVRTREPFDLCRVLPETGAFLVPFRRYELRYRRRDPKSSLMGPLCVLSPSEIRNRRRIDRVVPDFWILRVLIKDERGTVAESTKLKAFIRVLDAEGRALPDRMRDQSEPDSEFITWWLEEPGRYLIEFTGTEGYPAQRQEVEFRFDRRISVSLELDRSKD